MNINATTKVRDLALALPQSTRVFEKLKIDYCCGGSQPLAQACATAGLDIESVMKMLEQAGQTAEQKNGAIDLQNATLSELIAYILDKHHVYTKDEMTRLEPLMDKVVGAHGANHSELLAIRDLLRQLFLDLRPHMFKEEQILFPYILELERAQTANRPAPFAPFGTVNNPIRMMMMEHDTAGDLLREMRKLSSDYKVPADACISYKTLYEALEEFEQDLHQHIHLENNLLFPKAVELEEALIS
ncbi:MAG TPA: iron-sulfur cluster repair di-iron protein [Pyrinomonadaceae bacterium]|jgi:regulator of cell morphogenesis and NO signaling|nr:iron-sulfur cluster repair di-iron protein [Pyrinomonadaceae bacterium]